MSIVKRLVVKLNYWRPSIDSVCVEVVHWTLYSWGEDPKWCLSLAENGMIRMCRLHPQYRHLLHMAYPYSRQDQRRQKHPQTACKLRFIHIDQKYGTYFWRNPIDCLSRNLCKRVLSIAAIPSYVLRRSSLNTYILSICCIPWIESSLHHHHHSLQAAIQHNLRTLPLRLTPWVAGVIFCTAHDLVWYLLSVSTCVLCLQCMVTGLFDDCMLSLSMCGFEL